MAKAIYEKLGAFYLGKTFDLENRETTDELLLYDSKDLVTHAVVVGMTGSGKTGLGVGLIEEAAIDGVPVIIIDPKGDMSNLLLTFPNLDPSDFRPWINDDDATREGMTPAEFATKQADLWRNGLASWGQSPERIQMLRDAADFTVYTPGSDAGRPISILSSFGAPPEQVREDGDLFRDRISSTATSLLSLLGIDADPLRSREHILLTSIFHHAWSNGQDLDLGGIIRMVQDPPFDQVGVMDLDSFFSSKDRFELSMTLNNLLAAPSFSTWLSGDPLNIDEILYTPTGKPRVSVFSISHLSDAERMFFVSLLLNQTLGWMRSRSGTTSLRALLYIDEIFGYMPPIGEPPSKKPLLTLLKQARAFGLGLVLSTQNPVDLDYKGLSNTGTWFIGRLQTERDKDRVLDGLAGAMAEAGESLDRSTLSTILSRVGKRVFLLHNVHEQGPEIFQTRWALSYLAGPMTRRQIKLVMKDQKDLPITQATGFEEPMAKAPQKTPTTRPVLPPDIPEVFLPARSPIGPNDLNYEPRLIALVKVHFVDTRRGLAAAEELSLLDELPDDLIGADWSGAQIIDLVSEDLQETPLEPSHFVDFDSSALQSKSFTLWKKKLEAHLYRSRRFEIYQSRNLKEYSKPEESERDFRVRISDRAREERDIQIEKLRKKYDSKLRTLEDRIDRAEHAVERERQEASNEKVQTAISFGSTILSALFGRKKMSSRTLGRASSAARRVGRASKQAKDVERALANLEKYRDRLDELEMEIEAEVDKLTEKFDPLTEVFDTVQLKPRKSDIDVRLMAVAWLPFIQDATSGRVISLLGHVRRDGSKKG